MILRYRFSGYGESVPNHILARLFRMGAQGPNSEIKGTRPSENQKSLTQAHSGASIIEINIYVLDHG